MNRLLRFPRPLALLLLGFLALALLHSSATPVFEAPDEVWHYAYVRWLVGGHGLPSLDDDASGANQEAAQPPLYYAVAALLSAPFDDSDLDTLFWHNPNFGYQAPGTILDNKNMLIHTDAERFPWRGAALAIHVTRLTSVLFGVLTVLAAWGLGYEAFQTRKGALLTAALVAFQPQFVFMCGVINNDSAAAALTTLTLWATARVFRHGVTPRRVVTLGCLVGLAMLSKTSALALFFVVGAALCWQTWRERRALHMWGRALILYVTPAVIVGGWWYARNLWLYGDLLATSRHFTTPWRHAHPKSLLELWPDVPLLIRSSWGAYGWGHIFWPDWVYALLTLTAGICLIYGAWRVLRCARAQLSRVALRETADPTLSIYGLSVLWCVTIGAALVYWMLQVGAPHGRLLFPAIGAWALLMTYGSSPLRRTVNMVTTNPIFASLIIGMAALAALAPGARLYAAFAPPRLYSPQYAETRVAPVNVDYDQRIRLVGVDVAPARVAPAGQLVVKACWEALTTITEDYTVYVQLLGQNYTRVGERNTYPGLGRYPTSLWTPGAVFCDTYRFAVEPWAPAPERYQVLIGLYLDDSRAQLTAFDSAGQSRMPPSVGFVSVVPATPSAIMPAYPMQYTLGESITLQGYDLSGAIVSGAPLTLTLYWRAQKAVAQDYKVFVHVLAADGAMLTQNDGPPRNGWYPTSVWQAGDVIPDVRRLDIPELSPGQTLQLNVGMYRPDDFTRLAVFDGDGHMLPDGVIPLCTAMGECVVQTRASQ